MYFPSEHKIRQIKQDIERMKKSKENPLKIAGELIDFVIKTKLEYLRKMYPNVAEEELFKLLRKNVMELKERWKAVLKDL